MKRTPPLICYKWGIYNEDGKLESWATYRRWAREFKRPGQTVRKIVITPVGR